MKTIHVLGHNSNWNIDSYHEHSIGDGFLIAAYSHGNTFNEKKKIAEILEYSMLDLQFYGKKQSNNISGGKLKEFDFHPANCESNQLTSVYFDTCIKQAIKYQENMGFDNIIIPNGYSDQGVDEMLNTILEINAFVAQNRVEGKKYFMSLVFARDIVIDELKVEQVLAACTDMDVVFDGYFVVCESNFAFGEKVNKEARVIKNLATVFKTLKDQNFETIYGYANWDAILYLAITDIDYITIGTYENLRKFDITRFVQDESGGGSKGYYFSRNLLNMIKAVDLTNIREFGQIGVIKNDKNIFSEIILEEYYPWNIHKPDVNKNYLLEINKMLHEISAISLNDRKQYVMALIDNAISNYTRLEQESIFLTSTSGNYHLSTWKTILSHL